MHEEPDGQLCCDCGIELDELSRPIRINETDWLCGYCYDIWDWFYAERI